MYLEATRTVVVERGGDSYLMYRQFVNTHPFLWHTACLLPSLNFRLAASSTKLNLKVAIPRVRSCPRCLVISLILHVANLHSPLIHTLDDDSLHKMFSLYRPLILEEKGGRQ